MVRVDKNGAGAFTHTRTQIYIYIYVCVYVFIYRPMSAILPCETRTDEISARARTRASLSHRRVTLTRAPRGELNAQRSTINAQRSTLNPQRTHLLIKWIPATATATATARAKRRKGRRKERREKVNAASRDATPGELVCKSRGAEEPRTVRRVATLNIFIRVTFR